VDRSKQSVMRQQAAKEEQAGGCGQGSAAQPTAKDWEGVWTWGSGLKGQLGIKGRDRSLVPTPAIADDEAPDRDVPDQWHGRKHAGPPEAVADLIPSIRQDWFDDDVTHAKLQDRNPNRVGGAWPLGQRDTRFFSSQAIHVACGHHHTACVFADGNLWTWGDGEAGQLGHYNWESRRVPTLVHLAQSGPIAPAQETPKRGEIPIHFSPPAPKEGLGLGGSRAVMVACGGAHTAAVTVRR
jgi:alpha-tubulin suppressor-like RCC1 family protein